uniref:Bm10769 n=1 Tax=Brugia malayi TaxID=6279 RepID=A0A0H5S9W4_BRUMA|nr:Bm10769 [Brugia malayi]
MKRYSPGRSVFRKRNQQENLYPKLEQFSNDGDDSNDGNVSYESDHGEDDSERDAKKLPILTVLEWIWNLFRRDISILVLLFLVLAIIIVSLGLIYSLSNPNSEGISLKKYKQQVNGILKKSFTNEYEHGVNTKAVLRLIGEKWIYEKPVEPYVVLITGTKAGMLADALGDVFSNVTGKGEIDRIFCNEYKERQLLESEVTKSLSKHSKSVVLHGIDTLRGYAPLYLHSLSDADHSPFRSSLIILTINSFFGSHPNCEDEISSHLLNVWDSDYIGEDQIRPILSRISSFLICLED